MPELTDEELASLVQGGSVEEFGRLVERYESKMLRYARKFLFGYEDAEDLVQEVFLKAFSNIKGFDTGRKFSSWLYRIAHNEFINAIRKKGRMPLVTLDVDAMFPHPMAKEESDREAMTNELRRMLDECLDAMDAKYREPLVLYYYEELDYKEIAEILRIPVSTVGVRLLRAKDALKKSFQKKHPTYV